VVTDHVIYMNADRDRDSHSSSSPREACYVTENRDKDSHLSTCPRETCCMCECFEGWESWSRCVDCNTLQHTATCYNVIRTCRLAQVRHVAYVNVLRGGSCGHDVLTATHCNTLHHSALVAWVRRGCTRFQS